MSREILDAMKALAIEKGIAPDRLIHALEDALLSAYKKQPGAAKYARVEMDPDTGDYRVIELIVPERLEAHLIVETIDEGTYIDPETGEPVEPQDPEIDPAKFEEYRDQIDERDVTPDDFGRIAAQTAKQVILQRIREAERDMMFEEYRDRVGELITGIVQQSDSRYTLVQLRERVEALLPKSEQVDGERYDHSQRIKAVIKEVSPSTKGPSIIVSRRDPELIKKLFELEVPEIADGLVEIANVAREPGYRSKIAVVSYADGVDPVGACVGPRGSRVRMVVSELRGEKIDIIPYNDEPARFVAKALSPARVREVLVDDDARQATVVVPDDQLSLAIGREGQNARLAARLTGWRIDIKSETEFATEEPDGGYTEEETGGRCAAILGNGRRCPNAALPGSRFCGLDSHQALEGTGTVYVAGEPPPEALAENGEIEDAVAEEALAENGEIEEAVAEEALAENGEVEEAVVEEARAENGEVEEAVAEEALAEGAPSADGNDGLVVEAVAEDADALEPAPEAAEPEALAADTQPPLEAADGQPPTEAETGEPAPAEERAAEEPAS
jgi:N utilization substance protein A